jgi:UDP-glucose 4-epimerase
MFIKRIFIENKAPVVFGDGKQTRDFVYVKDVTRAHMLALEEESNGQVFNVSSGKKATIADLASLLVKKSGKKLDVVFDDPKEGFASSFQPERIRLHGELINFVMDCKKAHSILGWKAQTDFEEGLDREIEWVSKFPERWNRPPRV